MYRRRKMMLPNTNSSTRKPTRLWYATLPALAVLALLLIASPSAGASPQPQSQPSQPPQHPSATCPPDGQCFTDLPSDNPFYAFVNRIYQQDLVAGYPCGG